MNRVIHFIERWLSASGDTTFWSWVITILYGGVIVLCFILRTKLTEDRPRRVFWSSISLFVLAMGINKQLDVQTLIFMSGKSIAGRTGPWSTAV